MNDTTHDDGSQARPLHTPEPWIPLAEHPDFDHANISLVDFKRACVCVNACAGMQDPAAEIAALKAKLLQTDAGINLSRAHIAEDFILEYKAEIATLKRENKEIARLIGDKRRLRANQQTLVDALKGCEKVITSYIGSGPDTCLKLIREALNKIKE